MEEKPIKLLAFSANLKHKFDNCAICECQTARVFSYLQSHSAKEAYEAYTAIRISTDTHIFHETWSVALNAMTQRFLTKKVLKEAYDLVTQTSQLPYQDKLKY